MGKPLTPNGRGDIAGVQARALLVVIAVTLGLLLGSPLLRAEPLGTDEGDPARPSGVPGYSLNEAAGLKQLAKPVAQPMAARLSEAAATATSHVPHAPSYLQIGIHGKDAMLGKDLAPSVGPSVAVLGILVLDVEAASSAAATGLHSGDVIIEIGDLPVAGLKDAQTTLGIMGDKGCGVTTSIRFCRSDICQTMEITL